MSMLSGGTTLWEPVEETSGSTSEDGDDTVTEEEWQDFTENSPLVTEDPVTEFQEQLDPTTEDEQFAIDIDADGTREDVSAQSVGGFSDPALDDLLDGVGDDLLLSAAGSSIGLGGIPLQNPDVTNAVTDTAQAGADAAADAVSDVGKAVGGFMDDAKWIIGGLIVLVVIGVVFT